MSSPKSLQYGLVVFFLTITASLAEARTVACTKYTKFPVEIGVGGGENSPRIEYNTVIADVEVREEPDMKAKIIDRIKRCEKMSNYAAIAYAKKLGTAKIVEVGGENTSGKFSNLKLKKGDIVPVVQNLGEMQFSICAGDEEIEVEMYFPRNDRPESVDRYDLIEVTKYPVVQWWIRLTTPRGKTGYALGPYDDGDYNKMDKQKIFYRDPGSPDPAEECKQKR